MVDLKKRAAYTSFWIALAYVGIGTIMLIINVGDQNELVQTIIAIILLLTVPANFLGFGIIYGDGKEGIPLALVVQLVVFFGFWYFIFRLVFKSFKRKLVQEEYKNLKQIFTEMAKDAFEFSDALNWTYSFMDNNKEHLEIILAKLIKANYNLNFLVQNNEKIWTLEVSRIEKLTPEKLAKRNLAFLDLADKYNVKGYLGWNVEQLKNTTHNNA